jgi:hypothetical protein
MSVRFRIVLRQAVAGQKAPFTSQIDRPFERPIVARNCRFVAYRRHASIRDSSSRSGSAHTVSAPGRLFGWVCNKRHNDLDGEVTMMGLCRERIFRKISRRHENTDALVAPDASQG